MPKWSRNFPYHLQERREFCNKESWLEPQSAPGLVFADCIEIFHLQPQRIHSIWFWCWPSGDVHMYSHPLCCWKTVFAIISVFSWQNSVSLCPALLNTPRPNSPVTPGISWLPTLAFQSPMMKRTFFLVLILEGMVVIHISGQLQLLCC